MLRPALAVIAVLAATALSQGRALAEGVPSFSLTYLERFDIENEDEGLTEPSGLALSQGKNDLWTVSDDTKKIFKLGLDGKLAANKSFKIDEKELEGIALVPGGEFLLVVKEESNEILTVNIADEEVAARQPLSRMQGFDAVEGFFTGSGANKGLEGITVREETGRVYLLKEGKPGLLIKVSPDLQRIEEHRLLDASNGFVDDEVAGNDLDFSGLQSEPGQPRFWIVSDKARRLYRYDWDQDRVIQSARLGYEKGGKYKEIEKAEGVAIDPQANRLYVVSDEEARLYVYDLRW